MKNLFLFLWRNNYPITFLLLETLCVYLVVMNNRFQNTSAFNSSNAAVAKIMEGVNYFNEYLNLRMTNKGLSAENARLRTLLKAMNDENNPEGNIFPDTTLRQQYAFISAKVINNSINRRNNYLTLDKGSLNGVKSGMGVIAGSGVVGIVKNVSGHFCTVMSLLHKDVRISAKFKNNNYFGSLSWTGSDAQTAELRDIARHVAFKTGDTIVTTSFSAIFPENILAGTVTKSEIEPGDNFYSIEVKLSAGFGNLMYVYVIDNKLQTEQQQLQSETVKDDQ